MNFIQIDKKENYVILSLARPKVNAINHGMVTELINAFEQLESDDSVEGVILTGNPKIFSGGLDLIELYDYDEDKMRSFLTDFGNLHLNMVKFSKPLICAITGFAPAGGTVLALTADYRIMAKGDKFTMGLNEVAVNVQVTNAVIEAYRHWLGSGRAYSYIYTGKLLTSGEALDCGLVDELVPQEEVLERAEKFLQKFLLNDKTILKLTKQKLRSEWIKSLDEMDHEQDLNDTLKVWWLPEIRYRMQVFRAWLKSRK